MQRITRRSAIRRCLAVALIGSLLAVSTLWTNAPRVEALDTFDTEILTLINNHRVSKGLQPVVEYAPLSAASQAWSVNLINNMTPNDCPFNQLVHDSNGNIGSQGQPAGTTGFSEILACSVGPPGSPFPVNWSYNNMPPQCASPIDYASPLMQFCTWIDSTPHRQAVEEPSFTHIGVGSAINSGGGTNHQVSTARFSNAPKISTTYVPVNPARLVDSRTGAPWGQGEIRAVDVTGVGGVPAAGVEAVVLNVTTVSPTAPISWLTISPTGETASTTAAQNFGTASYTAELVNDVVIAKVGAAGTLDIRNEFGSVHLVIDVVGYYQGSNGFGYVPVTPTRLLDSRAGAAWGPGEVRQVDMTGVGPLPAAGVQAVVLNVTSVSPTANQSWLTISPTGEPANTTAAHNFGTDSSTNELSNDLVIAKVGAAGTIDIMNAHGNVHLVIDVVGYYVSGGGWAYQPMNPKRILDTRNATQGTFSTPWGHGETRTVPTTFGSCAKAVALNVTTVGPTAPLAWLTLSVPGAGPGGTAAVNFGTDSQVSELRNDLVIAPTGANGDIAITNSAGAVHLVIDLVGVYGTC